MVFDNSKRKKKEPASALSKLKKKFKKANPDLTEGSLVSYANRILRLRKMFDPVPNNDYYLNRVPNVVIKKITDSDMPINSKASIYSAIIVLTTRGAKQRNGEKMYKKQFDLLTTKIKEDYSKQVKTKVESDRWISSEKIKEARDDLLKKAIKSDKQIDYLKHLVVSLYSLIPPRRAMDYSDMKINDVRNKKGNTVFRDKKGSFQRFEFGSFKNVGLKGTQVFDREFLSKLPNGEEILATLDNWLARNKTQFFLLKPYPANSMVKKIQNIFKTICGKPVNINTLRHVYISDFLDKAPYLTEREIVAKFMGHSLSIQEIYRKMPSNKAELPEEVQKGEGIEPIVQAVVDGKEI